jgi:CHAT domain-containing protein/tetratricopeptide (TPR) repeat protein
MRFDHLGSIIELIFWGLLLAPRETTVLQDAATQAPRVVSVGSRVPGELRPAADAPGPDVPSAEWTLASEAAQRLTVLVESEEADTRLAVLDEAGREVAADDNGGIGDNPRVVFTTEAGRTYRIRIASSFPGEAGAYTLQVVSGESPLPVQKDKVDADMAYYSRALELARGRGEAGRRRAGWVLLRMSTLRSLLGLASPAEDLPLADEALAIAREAGDRSLEAHALAQQGLLYEHAGRSREAIQVLEQSLPLFREVGDEPGSLRPMNVLGSAHKSLGEYPRALEILEQTLVLAEKLGDRHNTITVLNNLAATHDRMDEYTRTLEYAERALGLARELKDERLQSLMETNVGISYLRLGRYQRALDQAEVGVRLARSIGDRREEASALEILAEAYYLVGRSQTALATEAEAVAVQRKVGDPRMLSVALTGLADLESGLGHEADSVAHYEEALRLRRSMGDGRGEGMTLNSLGSACAQAGRWDRALEVQQQALALAKSAGDRRGQARAQSDLAEAQLHLGRYADAAATAGESAAIQGELGFRDLEWAARAILGRAFALLGQPERARRELDAALALIEDIRTDIRGSMDRAGYLDRASTLFESYVALLLDQGEPEAALAMAERARARAFLDLLGSREAAGGPRPPPSATSALAAAAPPSVEQIRELARQRQATVVEYFTSAERLFVWVVQPDGSVRSTSIPLGRKDLTAMVDEMRGALGMTIAARDWEGEAEPPRPLPPGDLHRVLRRLYDALIAPVEAWLPRDPERLVTIVPHGPLFLVSFAALTDPHGRFLVEHHTLSYTPSVGVLHYTRHELPQPASAASQRLLIVGNPTMPALPGRRSRPPRLPGAEAEVRAISRLYPPSQVTALAGAKADERTVRELAPSHAIIHLATHGFIRDDEPLESLLVLAPSPAARGGPPELDDGLLTVRDVFELSLDARLVVLSGCNTGLGRINGDGVIGLARAFLYAGSSSVVASLWRVADVVAGPQMAHFYRALKANGGDAAHALRRAQLETIRDLRLQRYRTAGGRPVPPVPTFWASFVLIGDAR